MRHFKLKESFWRGLPVRRLEKELGSEGLVSLLKLCSWASVHGIEGSVFVGIDAKDIELVAEWHGEPQLFLKTTEATGCLKKLGEDGHYYIPDYIEGGE